MKNRSPRFNTIQLEDRLTPAAGFMPPTYFLFDPAQMNSSPSREAPLAIARSFLANHAAELGATPADLADSIVKSQYTDRDTGLTHIYLRQTVNGLEVAYADLNVTVAKDGRVLTAGGGFVRDAAAKLDAKSAVPLNTPLQAIDWAQAALVATNNQPLPGCSCPLCMAKVAQARAITTDMTIPNQVFIASADIEQNAVIASPISQENITARLQYVPSADGSAELAWNLNIQTNDSQHWYDLHIADRTGTMVAVSDWVADAMYNSIPIPNESVQDGGFTVITDPQYANASPFGWHDTNGAAGAEFTDTRGNNVDAHLDRDANNTPDASPARPSGTASLDFSSYSFDPAQGPLVLQNQDIAQVNLFTLNNQLHDIHYQYGFTPAAGNFQTNNYGQGGNGNDAVQADAQDGSSTNNANFATPVDGTAPRMQQFNFTFTTPNRDSDLDNGIIIHEYGHGVSNRLTGGPANSNALANTQCRSMGEGWSDWYALMLTQRPTDTQNAAFPMGTYVLGQAANGAGIRRKPYSYDMAINPLTIDTYGTSGTTSYGVTRSTEFHNAGEIWASALWDMNWLLINKYGYNSDLSTGWSATPGIANTGNKLALRLVMDAMKLQVANPTFVQARDAIIAADNALNGGADLLEIWTAFARRGLGQNAATTDSNATTVTESFTIPASVQNLSVTSIVPAVGSTVTTTPTAFTINVSAPLDAASVQASDLSVNGTPATSVAYTPGSTVVSFTYATTPVIAQGLQTVSFTAGAFTRASDANPLVAYNASFRYDALALQVTSTSPAAGAVLAPPLASIDINLNEAVLPSTVANSDLTLSTGTVTGFSLQNGNTTIRYTLSGLTAESSLTASIAAGAFTDAGGGPSLAFSGTYQLDFATRAFPTPLTAINPLGSQIYRGSTTGVINSATDNDDLTLNLDAGQTLTVLLTPAAGLRPQVTVLSPTLASLGTSTATTNGQVIAVTVAASTAGTYTIRVASAASTSGSYTAQANLNTRLEVESALAGAANNSFAAAEFLSGGTTIATSLGSTTRTAILGTTDVAGTYSATAITPAFDDISTTGTTATGFANTDDASISTTIPFSFNFYGTNYTTVYISTNGMLTFGSGVTTATNGTLTASSPTQATIAAFWDDLVINSSNGVKYQTLGTTGSRRFVVEWQNAQFWSSAGGNPFTITFEAVLYEGTNQIRFNYANLTAGVTAQNEGLSATIGIKNASTSTNNLVIGVNGSPSTYTTFVGSNKSTLIAPAIIPDFYSFAATAGQTVSLAGTTLGATPVAIQLFDTNGTTLLASGTTTSTNLSSAIQNFSIPATGTYSVAVTAAAQTTYSLSVVTNAAIDGEANDTAATAQPLGASRGAHGFVSSTGPNDDWYSIVLPAIGTTLELETATPADGAGEYVNTLNPAIQVYDAAGTTLLASGTVLADGRNEAIALTGLTPGGNYKIRIAGTASSGEYYLAASTPAGVPPTVLSTLINNGNIQRSRLTAIDVTFDSEVILAAGAFSITNGTSTLTSAANGGILVSTVLNGSQTTATITFDPLVPGVNAGSLSDGIWTLTLLASGTTGAIGGMPMTSDFTLSTIKRLFGDANGDGTVDATDFGLLGSVIGQTVPNSPFDFNNDGSIDGGDFGYFGGRFGMTI